MTLLDWSEKLAVGVEQVDHQHRELIESMNKLQIAVQDGRDHGVADQLLRKVAHDVQAHFASEEAIMAATQYPGAVLHGMKHQRLLAQMDSFFVRYERDASILNRHALNLLRDSVTIHIEGDDLNFGRWLKDAGKH